ncbi:MerC domain-containing protein [Microbulbifer halophilus]|uniref:MerC domain-containing protein n=1 Tax=Microbulbifer halophilus TaxID=453963 RepID=A0ABW5EEX2_9GAMM|nr:MerC domain-containing protein [Microbulbifer halophilus]MCW8128023.1 MerC domain-containing protein [Microbulbifer halophilus]
MMKDTAGMLVSGLCLVHCLATPLLLALGGAGMLGALLGHELFHLVLLGPVLLLALASFPAACRHHRRPVVMVSGFSGLLILIVALGLEGHWELLASTVGAGLLVAAHWANRRLLQRGALAGQGEDAIQECRSH